MTSLTNPKKTADRFLNVTLITTLIGVAANSTAMMWVGAGFAVGSLVVQAVFAR